MSCGKRGTRRCASQAMITRSTGRQPPHHTQNSNLIATLHGVPADVCCRTWADGATVMLRTSKSVSEAVDKERLPAIVRLSRSFWGDARPVI